MKRCCSRRRALQIVNRAGSAAGISGSVERTAASIAAIVCRPCSALRTIQLRRKPRVKKLKLVSHLGRGDENRRDLRDRSEIAPSRALFEHARRHTDNFVRRLAERDHLPHRILIFQIPVYERLIDNRHARRIRSVARRERASFEQRNPQRLKIFRRDVNHVGGMPFQRPCQPEAGVQPSLIRQGQADRRGFDSRRLMQPVQHFFIELVGLC